MNDKHYTQKIKDRWEGEELGEALLAEIRLADQRNDAEQRLVMVQSFIERL